MLGGGREARGWQLRVKGRTGCWEGLGPGDELFGVLGPAQGRETGNE